MKWWRGVKVTDPTLDQLLGRIAQLERQIERGPRVLQISSGEEVLAQWHPDKTAYDPKVRDHARRLMDSVRVPDSVRASLERSRLSRWGDLPAMEMSSVGWRDVLTPRRVLAADGAQILNTTTETIMCPDYTFAADYFEIGDAFKYTLLFDHSTVITTPGTHTFRLRYGGVAGTAMATSGAFAPDPTAASTTLSEMLEYWFICRAVGTGGSFFTMGRYTPNDFDDASATTIINNLNMMMIPTSAPAVVGSLDTTAAKAISPTYASSVATATTQVTNHIAILESLN